MFHELKNILKSWRIWFLLTLHETKTTYRNTILGPLWSIMNSLFFMAPICLCYYKLFPTSPQYVPYAIFGTVVWGFVSNILNGSPDVIIQASPYFHEMRLSYGIFTLKKIIQGIMSLLQGLACIIIVLYCFFHFKFSWAAFLLIPNLLFLTILSSILSISISIIALYVRDLSQLMPKITNVLFFLTPIAWEPSVFSNKMVSWITWNPISSMINLIRKPLMGDFVSIAEWEVLLVFFTIVCSIGSLLYRKHKQFIFYI